MFAPERVTSVPSGPDAGVKLVTVGGRITTKLVVAGSCKKALTPSGEHLIPQGFRTPANGRRATFLATRQGRARCPIGGDRASVRPRCRAESLGRDEGLVESSLLLGGREMSAQELEAAGDHGQGIGPPPPGADA